jgi:hypothetical protein
MLRKDIKIDHVSLSAAQTVFDELLSSKTKKDDFADCFLQGIWYLKQSKIITYADNLKINLV